MNKKLQKTIPIEVIYQLKRIDLLTYLKAFEPNTIVKYKKHYQSIIHDGLNIYKDKWVWKEQNLNGRTAIQYLVFVEKMQFNDALYLLYQCYAKELQDG